jgi:hypothetical protein
MRVIYPTHSWYSAVAASSFTNPVVTGSSLRPALATYSDRPSGAVSGLGLRDRFSQMDGWCMKAGKGATAECAGRVTARNLLVEVSSDRCAVCGETVVGVVWVGACSTRGGCARGPPSRPARVWTCCCSSATIFSSWPTRTVRSTPPSRSLRPGDTSKSHGTPAFRHERHGSPPEHRSFLTRHRSHASGARVALVTESTLRLRPVDIGVITRASDGPRERKVEPGGVRGTAEGFRGTSGQAPSQPKVGDDRLTRLAFSDINVQQRGIPSVAHRNDCSLLCHPFE